MSESKFTILREDGKNSDPNKKNLVVNAAVCDARKVSEETLGAYDSVTINAASVITTKSAREILHRYNVVMNAADVTDIPEDADLVVHNGSYTIAAGSEGNDARPAALVVNGKLTVEKGAEAALSRFISIQVNGKAVYPRSMERLMGTLKVNGASEVYPDDAVLLKNTFVVDRVFILRAKGGKYYAKKRVILTTPGLDVSALAAKGVSFITEKAVIAEPLLEAALPLFSEETEVVAVPEGCVFIGDDAELTEGLISKNGGKLYINGSFHIPAEAAGLLSRLEFLRVTGDVRLPRSLMADFAGLDAEYGKLIAVRGVLVYDKIDVKIDRALLERNTDGVTVTDCVEVRFRPDVPPELILERLELRDCVNVRCSPEQRSAVEQVSSDVAHFDEEDDSTSTSGNFGGQDGGLLGGFHFVVDELRKNKVINAATYTL